MLKALLSNFDIDGDAPKPEHVRFLEGSVVPLLANGSGQIWMQGSASRTGSDAHNMDLSRRRVRKVADVLKGKSILESQMQLDAVGESMSFGPKAEDPSARAVALVILPRRKEDPPPPRVAPPPPKVNTNFKLKMHANLNIAKGLAADFSIFQIWDQKAGLCSFYTYWAGGGSGGLVPGAWLSATMPGDWNYFSTNKPLAVNQFGGPARFTTGGVGPWSKNYVNFMGLPPGTMTVPNPLPFSTGFTIGIGAGTSVGTMRLEKLGTADGLLPFAGP
jgi:hypothetical protein